MTEKKLTAREKAALKATEEVVVKPKAEVTAKKEVKKSKKAEPRRLGKHDDIEIMNNTTGRYGYKSRSGFALEMDEYGDTISIPFGELEIMRSSQKRHIEDAFIVILDEEAVKQLRYEKLYENVLDYDGVEEVLQDFERLEKMLSKMPATMRETVGAVATQKFRNGDLYDKRVQKVIEDNLKIKIDS